MGVAAAWVIRLARGNRWEWLAVGTLGGSVALAAHNLVDSLFVSGMGLTFAMFIAVTYALEWQFRGHLASRETVRV